MGEWTISRKRFWARCCDNRDEIWRWRKSTELGSRTSWMLQAIVLLERWYARSDFLLTGLQSEVQSWWWKIWRKVAANWEQTAALAQWASWKLLLCCAQSPNLTVYFRPWRLLADVGPVLVASVLQFSSVSVCKRKLSRTVESGTVSQGSQSKSVSFQSSQKAICLGISWWERRNGANVSDLFTFDLRWWMDMAHKLLFHCRMLVKRHRSP